MSAMIQIIMSSLFNGNQDPFETVKMHTCTHTIQPTTVDVYRFPEVHPHSPQWWGRTTWTELRTPPPDSTREALC